MICFKKSQRQYYQNKIDIHGLFLRLNAIGTLDLHEWYHFLTTDYDTKWLWF